QRVVEVPIHDEDPLPHCLDVQPIAQEDEQVDRVDETAERPAPDDRVAQALQPAHEPRTPGDLLERDGSRRPVPRGAGTRVPADAQYRIQADIAVHEIGRASCRERWYRSGVAVAIKHGTEDNK